jgi:hypothetical protein
VDPDVIEDWLVHTQAPLHVCKQKVVQGNLHSSTAGSLRRLAPGGYIIHARHRHRGGNVLIRKERM